MPLANDRVLNKNNIKNKDKKVVKKFLLLALPPIMTK
jgi:hypothetical protein